MATATLAQLNCASETEVMDRLNTALRALKVLQSTCDSPDLIGDDLAMVREWRRRCIARFEDTIEQCIGVLDAIHGDPDLEQDDHAECDDDGPDPADRRSYLVH